MQALLLTWDLSDNDPEIFQRLRSYVAQESWQRYANRGHLIQKVWFSNIQDRTFGAFYLWETDTAMEEEIASMYRVEDLTGVAPDIMRLEVEAIQEGIHETSDLRFVGSAWTDPPFPET